MAKADKKGDKKPRTPRQPVDRTGETKAQKFSRLASKRVNKALKAVRNIGNLSGAGYESTQEQRDKIADLLTNAVKATLARFADGGGKKGEEEITI